MDDLTRLGRLVTHLAGVRELRRLTAAREADARTLSMRALLAREDAVACAELVELTAKVTGPDAFMTEGPSCGMR